jgi:hypothetical protein
MTIATRASMLTAFFCLATPVRSQLLAGDEQFPIVNQIRWDMNASDIRNLCENQSTSIYETDSTLVFRMKCFGVFARTKVQFNRSSHIPLMVDIGFEESTEPLRDTLINHFTATTGKRPLVTTKEKNMILFTFKIELSSWKNDTDTFSVMTMGRGNSLLGLSVLISPTSTNPKQPTGENKALLN